MGRVAQHGIRWQENRLVAWIAQYSKTLKNNAVMGIGDDASIHQPIAGEVELVTCDALVENSHWSFAWCDPVSLGYKAAAVNLSDIAAMGGTPHRAHLVLGLPPKMEFKVIQKIVKSLMDTFHAYGVALVGGDTVASPAGMTLAVYLQGSAVKQQVMTREKARSNDLLLVTGQLGDAAAALDIVVRRPRLKSKFKPLIRKLLRPSPRVNEARTLAQTGKVSAMMDLSDGLSADLKKMAKASHAGARVYAAQLPLSKMLIAAARDLHQDPQAYALGGGEDYELLFATAPQNAYKLIEILKTKHKIKTTIIGEVLPLSLGVTMMSASGQKTTLPDGWEHRG
ncbi:thiamine-phosphate kinase [bacterium]|nr:thiamine-phosphate kinase [bacterium]